MGISPSETIRSLPSAMPSAAAWTTRPNVAVHVAFGLVMTNEPDESRTRENVLRHEHERKRMTNLAIHDDGLFLSRSYR